jgi:hypothetical protein
MTVRPAARPAVDGDTATLTEGPFTEAKEYPGGFWVIEASNDDEAIEWTKRASKTLWFDGVLPGEPVVLATQTANVGSMRLAAKLGFTEAERFRAWDAEQWLGMWSPVTQSD